MLKSALKEGAILALDGNSCTGKTTILQELVSKNQWNLIAEHSSFFRYKKVLKSKKDYLHIQKKFLLVDKKRQKFIDRKNVNVMDRSILSVTAHVYALYKQNKIDIRKEYYEVLCDYVSKGYIILPDMFIYVTCDNKIIEQRYKERHNLATKSIVSSKGQYYVAADYLKYVAEFNQIFYELYGSIILNTSKNNAKFNVHKLNNTITKCCPTKKNVNKILTSIKKALEL